MKFAWQEAAECCVMKNFFTYTITCITFFFSMARQPLGGLGRLSFRGFTITLLDTPQSVGLLWTRDQLVAETSTWQHTTLTRDRHPCPGGIRTHNPSKRAAADARLRPHDHWDRHIYNIRIIKLNRARWDRTCSALERDKNCGRKIWKAKTVYTKY
jgi:hypothetical protein